MQRRANFAKALCKILNKHVEGQLVVAGGLVRDLWAAQVKGVDMYGSGDIDILLIGNSEVYSRLQGRQQAQFAQLFSRIRMQREYTTRKVKEDDVRKLFPVLAEQDARKEMDFLLSVCRSPWGIRGAMNLYTNAASANDVSYENLYRMAAHMGIGMLGAV